MRNGRHPGLERACGRAAVAWTTQRVVHRVHRLGLLREVELRDEVARMRAPSTSPTTSSQTHSSGPRSISCGRHGIARSPSSGTGLLGMRRDVCGG